MSLKYISQKLDEINSSDLMKITEDDFKKLDVTKINKLPESLPAYQVITSLGFLL